MAAATWFGFVDTYIDLRLFRLQGRKTTKGRIEAIVYLLFHWENFS